MVPRRSNTDALLIPPLYKVGDLLPVNETLFFYNRAVSFVEAIAANVEYFVMFLYGSAVDKICHLLLLCL